MTQTATFETHPTTGYPVQPVPDLQPGDLVTERINGDGYPAVVVHRTPKRVYVRKVEFVGNFSADDAPGYNGYGDSGTIVIDPEDVKAAVEQGPEGARKYVLHVSKRPSDSMSLNEQREYGADRLHRSGWRSPGGSFYLTSGATYRQDPHV